MRPCEVGWNSLHVRGKRCADVCTGGEGRRAVGGAGAGGRTAPQKVWRVLSKLIIPEVEAQLSWWSGPTRKEVPHSAQASLCCQNPRG